MVSRRIRASFVCIVSVVCSEQRKGRLLLLLCQHESSDHFQCAGRRLMHKLDIPAMYLFVTLAIPAPRTYAPPPAEG